MLYRFLGKFRRTIDPLSEHFWHSDDRHIAFREAVFPSPLTTLLGSHGFPSELEDK